MQNPIAKQMRRIKSDLVEQNAIKKIYIRKEEEEWTKWKAFTQTSYMSYVLILWWIASRVRHLFHFYSFRFISRGIFPFCCDFACFRRFIVRFFLRNHRIFRCCKRIVCLQYRYHLQFRRIPKRLVLCRWKFRCSIALVYSGMLSILGIGKVSWLSILSNGIYLRLKFFFFSLCDLSYSSVVFVSSFTFPSYTRFFPYINFCILYASRSILCDIYFLVVGFCCDCCCRCCCWLFVHSIKWCFWYVQYIQYVYRLSVTFSITILYPECIYCVWELFHLQMRLMKSNSIHNSPRKKYLSLAVSLFLVPSYQQRSLYPVGCSDWI